ncbi:MAG: acyl-ACP--UDP-N-acetylglucosamine O-acyltransferase [Thermoguttaceae bacterium]|nr:acyl-ACP--UDP-N-acetylglucosamine O-acyltransferase [Thermoguttaceae bacterium]MDW8037644.1 acyl-ACP--UDP-N-acetylglucosamine O-acyltransferase [Thermoguttaceae bacterium]
MGTVHLSVISPEAQIGQGVEIGPFCVIESDVVIGDRCRLAAGVVIHSGTRLGPDNRIFEGAVLGGLPQHVRIPDKPGLVIIGAGNVIREHVTVHRSLYSTEATRIGDNNLLMVNVHVAHDCQLGSHIVVANNTMLAGHIEVADRAYLSGAVAVHQFCRIGAYAMVGGQAHINQDVPPYVTVDGLSSRIVGLNFVGLRRAGFSSEDILQLKRAYRVIYRSGLRWEEILEILRTEFAEGPAALFYPFLASSKRGIVSARRPPSGGTLKLLRPETEEHLESIPIAQLQRRQAAAG